MAYRFSLVYFNIFNFLSLVFSLVFIFHPSAVHALRYPHAAPKITLCSDCHTRIAPGFASITSQNVLCINAVGCHNFGGKAEKKSLTVLDASNRFGNLTELPAAKHSSHGWKIPNLNVDAGVTRTDKWGELATGFGKALNENILCTRCHRAHGEKTGYVIYDKFLRQTPTGNYICMQCHAARQISNVRDPKPADKHYSHPVEVNYSTVRAGKPDWFYTNPLNPYSSNPSAVLKLSTTVDVDGMGRIIGVKGTNQVVCQTCHGPLHSSDSNPYTFDNITTYSKTGTYSTSAGNLLRRYPITKSNDLCQSCHKVQTHRGFMCNRCHTPHKKAGENNRYLIHENISTPNSGRKAVQFVSTSHPAQRYGSSNKICQVCHTNTRYHRNYSSAAARRDHKYNSANDTYRFCPDCHSHLRGFLSESMGNTACSTEGCHDDFFGPMNATGNGYHHYLNNANVTVLASGSKYPVINPPSPLGGVSDQNRRCIQCHVEHDIFKPELNPKSPGRAYNLRTDISFLPNRTTAGVNTDFISKYGRYSTYLRNGIAPNGGICLSCHQNSQTKSYVQADGTTKTPVINKTLFDDSPHQFTADATFNNGATVFKANCSKCHIDTLNKSKQGGGNQFGPHFSNVRRIQAGSSNTNNAGTVSNATSTTLADSNIPAKNWEIDIWKGWTVTILEGTGAGQSRTVSGNDATTITVSSAWTTIPNSTSRYLIGSSREFDSGTATGAAATKVSDNTKSWTKDYWTDRPVTIIQGAGRAQTRRIIFNSATGLTVDEAWNPSPDTTSVYSIGDPMEEELCFKCHSRQSNPYASQNKDYYGVKTFDNTKTLRMEELFNDAAKPFKHRIDRYFAKHRGDESETAPAGATSTGWFNDGAVTNGLHSGCADCHNPHGNRKPGEDNGVATGGSSLTLVQAGKSWAVDQWRGYTLRLMDGAGRGQDRMIVANTADTLTVAASFVTNPASGTYYIITPIGLPNKGNNLWNPNSGTWGVTPTYGLPTVGSMAGPTFEKKSNLTGGTNKIYELCFKCHSEYGWGTGGTPFTIPDSFNASGVLGENQTTNIAQEFNPNNLGYHPVVDVGANQPITPTGFSTVNIVGPFTATGGSVNSATYTNTWNPNRYNGMCIEITGGTGAGQVRSITGHDSTGITNVDPNFSTAPASGSTFVIRKCSSFSSAWPRFTGGVLELTAGSPTARIRSLTNGIPSTVINGWYIYAGTISGSPPAPPQLTTSGWFQINGISAGASNSGTTDVYLTITPTPTQSYNSSYAITAGLGNAFVPPYGPWSVMGCADCHDTDDSRDPSGPHASARNWMVRMLESQIFPWYYGGTSEGASTTDPSMVKMVGYPDGSDAGWSRDMSKFQCINCHRSDVYTARNVPVSGGSFLSYQTRDLGRIPHAPIGYGAISDTKYGIYCMQCHGGDNRPVGSGGARVGSFYLALGGIHGSNLGLGNAGSSFRGRRLLNGATWSGVTRSATNATGTCAYNGGDAIGQCSGGNYPGGLTTALYPYFSGADMYLPTISSAVATDSSGGHTGVQSGDTVVVRFDGETQANSINVSNINTALALNNGHTWGSISGASWSTTTYQNDTLTVTIGSGSSIVVGDTITVGGDIIKNILGMSISGSTAVTGSFGFWVVSAIANDNSGGGPGIQTGDQVVVRFDGATMGTAINAGNINSALMLNNGHVWGTIQGAAWSDTVYSNDTLTITLSTSGVVPTVVSGDTVTLGTVIRDSFNNAISNPPFMITGTFASIPNGAVGHWRFDENSGSTAYDDTTNYNHGTIYNSSWTTGRSGSALSFNGGSSVVSIPDSDTFDLTTAGTLEMWVKKGSSCGTQYLSKGNDYRLFDNSSCQVGFKWGSTFITAPQRLMPGGWYHVVATYDASGNRNIYLNGQNVATAVVISSAPVNTSDLRIGNWSTSWFNGVIDSVVVYNRAITAQEAFERYNKVRSATANNASGGGMGIQAGDQVVIRFNTVQGAVPASIDSTNIDAALALSNGHTWGTIAGASWTTTTYTNDTLTVTLNTGATVKVGDVITLGGVILDGGGRPVTGSVRIGGSFGAMPGMPDGVVGYWKLDEMSGQTVSDSSANGNAGTLGASSAAGSDDPAWNPGRFGNSLNFDGSNDYAQVADSDSLDLTEQITVELWINKDANRPQSYLSKGTYVTSGGDEYALYESDSSGTLSFKWGGTVVSSASPVSTGAWNHIVGTYDGTTARLYINGVESANAAAFSILSAGTEPLYIGRNSAGNYVDGRVDDVVVYNRALSAGEVAGRYAANLKTAVIRDTAGNGRGMQAGDRVIITFDGPTNGAAINTGNVNSAITLSNGHAWGAVSSAWSNTGGNNNDTLTITLGDTSSTISVGDTLTLAGGIVQDTSSRPVVGSAVVGGTFDSILNGTVGYWNFDENSGATVYDASVNSNHGQLMITTWAAGRSGSGVNFINTASSVTVKDSNSLDLTNAGTVEFWVKKVYDESGNVYVSKANSFSVLDNYGTGQLTFRWANTSSGGVTTDMRIYSGIWYHIAAVYDGSSLRIYINGELSKSAPYSTNAAANSNPLYFGYPSNNLGVMDGVAIYNRALTATEVRQRYGSNIKSADADDNSGSGAGIQTNDRVVIRFSEATGADLIDAGNINTALALNSGSWLDGAGGIVGANWTTTTYSNDTLTITLRANTSAPAIRVGNTITLSGAIRDAAGYPIYGSVAIGGSFGAISGMPDGAVGYWKLDESSGTTASDQSMNGNNGTTTGSPAWTTGRFGNGLALNGTSQYVMINDSNSLDLFKAGTIEFWAKKNSNANNQTYLSKGSVIPYFLVNENGTSGQVRFYWGGGSVTTTNPAPLGVWNHIVCVYDGTDLRIYVNGILAATPVQFQLHTLAPNSNPVYLGRSATGNYLNGTMDDVVIYNRALSAAEVQQRFVNTFRDARSYDISLADVGVQAGDQVVIRFIGGTDGPVINASNIDSVLQLSGGHSWKDAGGGITGANWTSAGGSNNDTLTITLSANGGIPTVAGGDTVTLGTLIKDTLGRSITGSATILNDFDVPKETVGYWRFNETSGTSAYDSSVTVNNGTVTGATWTAGKFGNALSFNGVSDWYVAYPSNSAYTLPGDYTLEAWVKPTSWPTNGDGAILFNGGAFFLYNFALYSDGKIGFSYNSSGSIIGRNTAKATTPLVLNDWNHVLVTRSGGTAVFYINGVASGSFIDNHYTATNGSLYTGRGFFTPDYFRFPGLIDEVAIYNRSLTASEVKRRYRTWMSSARGNNNSGGGSGVQAGDQVVIVFDGGTTAQAINSSNIDTALALNNGHAWGAIAGANWSTTNYTDDTLTVTLNPGATVNVGDTMTLGGIIKDSLYRTITGSRTVTGSFAPMPTGAVAYYKLDEAGGDVVIDGTSNNNHGTIRGSAARVTGKSGSGLSFNGTDSYVDVPSAAFGLANAMSIEVWVKAADQANGKGIVDLDAATIKSWSDINGNEINPGVITDSGWQGSGWITGGNVFDNANWHHLVLTWDGTNQRFYVDGVEVGGATGTGTLASNTALRIGNLLSGSGFYNGQVDEIVIYNKALTLGEVQSRFSNP